MRSNFCMGAALVWMVLASVAAASLAGVEGGPFQRSLRRLAAADNADCPHAALTIIPALPNVKDAATFKLVRATYIDTVKRLAPDGAISNVIPTQTDRNAAKGGISVHTTILFSGSCEAGKAAARALHVKLLGDVRPLFHVPAPRAKSLFGDVYMITVSHPYLADGTGAKLVAPAAPAGTNLAAQFSITWEDVPPSKIGELQAAAFKAAILKQLPSGAGVYFTTMITEGVSYRFGNHWRACAAPVSPTVAKSSGKTSQGGSVWPPGQPTTVKSGRLVFNTNIHGTTFNAVAGKAALTKFMDVLRTNTAVVFPPRAFGRLALEPGYGVRLVNSPAFPCACQGSSPSPSPSPSRSPSPSPPSPRLTLVQAFGPSSATSTASGAASITWAGWEFTATPSTGRAINQTSSAPLVWWYNLAAGTRYTISVVGITSAGQRVKGASTLAISTPSTGAPTVAAATATSATQATVRLTPPTSGQQPSLYIVSLCLQAKPTSCVRQNSSSIQLAFTGLAPGARYVASATAKIGSTTSPASNTQPLTMPQRGAPVLLTAAATSAAAGAATAAAPGGTTFSKYVFTAVSPSGAPNVTSTVADPLKGSFTGLRPATQYNVSVVGYSGVQASPRSNTLSFVTPAADAPLNTGTPSSPTQVVVRVVPPTSPPRKGGSWVAFEVTLCPIAGPQSACNATRVERASGRRVLADSEEVPFSAVPDTTYNAVTTAVSQSGERSSPSLPSQVTTPAVPLPAPGVKVSPGNPVLLVCSPPPQGPWKTCAVDLCPSGQDGDSPCTSPVSLACDFQNGGTSSCDIDVTFMVEISQEYKVTSTAVKAGGMGQSLTQPQLIYILYPFPEPYVTAVRDRDDSVITYLVTIMPNTDTPLVSYPAGGWSYYRIVSNAIPGLVSYCPAKNISGIPQPVDCTVQVQNRPPITFSAEAIKGLADPPPKDTDLKSGVAYYTPPVIISAQSSNATSGSVCLSPALQYGVYAGYNCTLCKIMLAPVCGSAQVCSSPPPGQGSCAAVNFECALNNLQPSSQYSVTCVGISSFGAYSKSSNTGSFTTPAEPLPPIVLLDELFTMAATFIITVPPTTGDPWVKSVCTVALDAQPRPADECSQPTSCGVSNLDPDTTYTVTCVTVKSNGQTSPPSLPVTFTTLTLK